jgi:N-acetylneuraminic acid mutarotase
VLGGETYAAGGQGTSRPMANVEVYDPGTNTWTAVTSLPATRKSGVAASIGDQVIFSIGYFNTTFYTNTWIANAP